MATPARSFGRDQVWVVAQRIRRRRDDLDLTQDDLMDRLLDLGMSTTDGTISNFEHGTGLGAGKLPALAVALECSVTYLLGLTDKPAKWSPDMSLREAVDTRAKLHGRSSRFIQPPLALAH